jgi:prepilin-type N-terminal cleavage/methylation domain-containing protein
MCYEDTREGNMRRDVEEQGFTLVELAIVMVIIGLMIGAVLKGQAMIDDAKQKRLLNDLQGISVAYFTYYDRYNAVAGDDSRTRSWDLSFGGGNGDGLIDGEVDTPSDESQDAWQALRYAGLLSGDPTVTGPASLPSHPFGGKYGIIKHEFETGVGTKNCIYAGNIAGDIAEMVDIRLDDGVYNSGSVQANRAYSSDTVNIYYAL